MDIFDIALTMTPGVGGVTASMLIAKYFTAERVFSATTNDLIESGVVSERVAMAISGRVGLRSAEQELEYCRRHGIIAIASTDVEYPPLLREIHNSPHVIYAQGDISILTHNLISMVGTRTADENGLIATDILVKDIAKNIYNPVIVSGLAFGADSYAHRAAMSYNVPTIAVLPTALPNITPSAHKELASMILSHGGVLLSELNSKNGNSSRAFISRNRIIAGLSQGTILIQSSYSDGAMQTMQMVSEMKRTAMAIPGRINDFFFSGCNKLITLGEATSVSSAENIIGLLGWRDRRKVESVEHITSADEIEIVTSNSDSLLNDKCDYNTPIPKLSEEQESLLRSMMTTEPIHVSALGAMNPMSVHKFNGLLIEMELMGLIIAHSGSLYQRAVRLPGQS